MNNHIRRGAPLLLLLGALPLAAAAEDRVSRGAVLASTCFTCHGTDGTSPGSMPSIAGIPSETMVEIMQSFRSGERPATVMDRHARGYTDEEIQVMADYLAELK